MNIPDTIEPSMPD